MSGPYRTADTGCPEGVKTPPYDSPFTGAM